MADKHTLTEEGLRFYADNRYRECIEKFAPALAMEPHTEEDLDLIQCLAHSHTILQAPQKALEYYQALLASEYWTAEHLPLQNGIWMRLARLYQQLDKKKEANQHISQIIDSERKDGYYYEAKSIQALEGGHIAEALSLMEFSIDFFDDQDINFYPQIIDCLLATKDFPKARYYARKAILQGFNRLSYWRYLGYIEEQLGHLKRACIYFRLCWNADHTDKYSLRHYVRLLIRFGKWKEAWQVFQQAVNNPHYRV